MKHKEIIVSHIKII